ncbi:MAG: 2-oxoacid:acceptor oxidoreductase family protein [Candidatus Shikimatogenerans bostrichidophilus]|nr:MAG: 2-oxoacid:acceptor oxidoreductase family protein [Candidatus Shikimatogenerans bostrichidophilus]
MIKYDLSIILTGYSGEGIQYIGHHFCYILYKKKINFKTFIEIPSEINSPIKEKENISNFIIRFSNKKIISYYNKAFLLLTTNYNSLKKNINNIKKKAIIILYFDNYNKNLLKNDKKLLFKIKKKKIIYINSLKYIKNKFLIKKKISLSKKKFIKNTLILGFLFYYFNLFDKKLSYKFFFKKKNKNIALLNYKILKLSLKIAKKKIKNKIKIKSNYKKKRNIINGNYSIVIGLLYFSIKSKLGLFYSSYPITPSTTINDYFKKIKKNFNIIINDSEDEISAICSSIGASLSGKKLGIVATSGPGMSLIQESLGLAVVLEVPLIIINVQRAGPSTGLPTKIEQSDLMQSIYGRHGEAPIPIIAINNIKNVYKIIILSCKLSIKFKTPIIILSDSFISNNLILFKFKKYKIKVLKFKKLINKTIGGLSDINKHQKKIKKRQKKINLIKKKIKKTLQYIFYGKKSGSLLIIGWGSTYEIIKETVKILLKKYKIGYIHFILIYPLNYNILDKIYKNYNKILIIELNNKQFIYIIKSFCKKLKKIYSYNQINGEPLKIKKLIYYIKKLLKISK